MDDRAQSSADIGPGVLAAYGTVTTLFFAWGFITSLVDPLVAAVKGIFQLSDVEAQLSASAFFLAYGVMSFPSAIIFARRRSTKTIIMALSMMLFGCLAMLIAANIASYLFVLIGLFILASGITMLQVAANPLASSLGKPALSHLRLTLAQALNSLGTFIGPYVGAQLFLPQIQIHRVESVRNIAREAALGGIDRAFFWIAGLLVMLVAFFAFSRKLIARAEEALNSKQYADSSFLRLISEAISSRWTLFGGLAIFCYVGAEVTIGTHMAFFLSDESVFNIPLQEAGKLVSLYWGGAMLGRVVGSALLSRMDASRVLLGASLIALSLCVYVFGIGGSDAGYAALSIGLMNSVMFPVIFTLTLERSSARVSATSGFLCFSIVGGAAMPPLAAVLSQGNGYAAAFVVPAVCYALVALFAALGGRVRCDRLVIRGEAQPH